MYSVTTITTLKIVPKTVCIQRHISTTAGSKVSYHRHTVHQCLCYKVLAQDVTPMVHPVKTFLSPSVITM